MNDVIEDMIPSEVHLLKCPKCGVLWNSVYSHDEGSEILSHYSYDNKHCPSGCYNFFGFSKWGKFVRKVNNDYKS